MSVAELPETAEAAAAEDRIKLIRQLRHEVAARDGLAPDSVALTKQDLDALDGGTLPAVPGRYQKLLARAAKLYAPGDVVVPARLAEQLGMNPKSVGPMISDLRRMQLWPYKRPGGDIPMHRKPKAATAGPPRYRASKRCQVPAPAPAPGPEVEYEFVVTPDAAPDAAPEPEPPDPAPLDPELDALFRIQEILAGRDPDARARIAAYFALRYAEGVMPCG